MNVLELSALMDLVMYNRIRSASDFNMVAEIISGHMNPILLG
jgi:hypothetical protein